MGICERIKERRKSLNMTQEALGEAVGMAAITIRQYENGARTPNLETIQKLAEELGTSASYLIDGTGEKERRWVSAEAWDSLTERAENIKKYRQMRQKELDATKKEREFVIEMSIYPDLQTLLLPELLKVEGAIEETRREAHNAFMKTQSQTAESDEPSPSHD